tara:strand:+ start:53 stop:685 length:633 start_codon:yes stop_codon:yes gene_type:complete
MGGLYEILESYRQQNDPRFVYEGLYEEPAYTGPNVDPMYNLGARQFGNMERMTGIMKQAPLQNLGIDTSYGVANEADEEVDIEETKQPSGLQNILQAILGFAIPGAGLITGGLESLRGFNDRLQNSDFGQSKTLADYFDARSYGGRQARDDMAARNMVQARGIQKEINKGKFGGPDINDRGRGNIGSSNSPSKSYSAPQQTSGSGGLHDY